MAFEDLALQMDRWVDRFGDKFVRLSSLQHPENIPSDLETLRRLRIAHGQITTMHPKKEQDALGQLHQQMILNPAGTRGYGAVAQRGDDGRVRLTVVSRDGRSVVWQGMLPRPVPAPRTRNEGVRRQELEDGVRKSVARAARQRFRRHRHNEPGSDLVPYRRRSRAGRRRPMPGPRRRMTRARPTRRPRGRRQAFDAFAYL